MANEIPVAPNPNPAAPVIDPNAPPAAAPAAIVEPVAPVEPVQPKSLLDEAVDPEQAAENKRLLESKLEDLNDEEKAQRKVLEDAEKERLSKIVPEKYVVKLPEGVTEDGLLEKLTPAFKEIGLTTEQVQKLVDAYTPYFKERGEAAKKAFVDGQEANFKAFVEKEQETTHKALGTKEQADASLAYAAKARDRFYSPATRELFNASGIANNISFILDTIKIGKMISESKLADGRPAPSGDMSAADVLYPKQGTK